MSRRALLTALAAVALSWAGCYQDDASVTALQAVRPQITVRLTDAPFPYDSLHSVNIYVVRIEANTAADTSGGGQWALITEPRKPFDLLALQQGATAILGQGEMPAGQYHSVRMTIDTSLSSITWNDAAQHAAQVNWHGFSAVYAFVEYPVNVATQGADIVLDFDIGRSFQYRYYGTNAFDFMPNLRAINSAAAGAIAGTVTQNPAGTTSPVPNAQVYVYTDSIESNLEATGRSDQAGHYKVGFLPPGSYFVKIEEPFIPSLEPVVTPNVQVTVGGTATVSVLLPQAGGGHAYIHISGPTQVGVGGGINLFAAVGDANGSPIQNPSITWTSSDPTVAAIQGGNDTVTSAGVSVRGVQAGVATIHATSGGLTDSLVVQVVALGTLASVSVVPANATVTVGDSLPPSSVPRLGGPLARRQCVVVQLRHHGCLRLPLWSVQWRSSVRSRAGKGYRLRDEPGQDRAGDDHRRPLHIRFRCHCDRGPRQRQPHDRRRRRLYGAAPGLGREQPWQPLRVVVQHRHCGCEDHQRERPLSLYPRPRTRTRVAARDQ